MKAVGTAAFFLQRIFFEQDADAIAIRFIELLSKAKLSPVTL